MSKRTRKRPPPRSRLIFDVRLRDIDPPIWRRVSIPEHYTLHQVHRVLQLLFGWLDYHLYQFEIGDRRFEAPDEEAEYEDSTAIELRQLELRPGSTFQYVYDLGDYWVHDVAVEEVLPVMDDEDQLPALLSGERVPHEDAGGVGGMLELRKVLRKQTHPDHGALRGWAGNHYDPERFDPWLANQNLVLIAAWETL
jgi:Plasmid pRiA4b ORF-3-like protein